MYQQLTYNGGPPGVEVLLDGDGKPIDCLVGRWLPWNSVWIEGQSPEDALYSNSFKDDYYRFQVLNDPEGHMDWKALVADDYEKFSDSSYPYQLWEPDGQRDILSYISIYGSGSRHAPGFHFAINIDIGMFYLYSHTPPEQTLNMHLISTTTAEDPEEALDGQKRIRTASTNDISNSFVQPFVTFLYLEDVYVYLFEEATQQKRVLCYSFQSNDFGSGTGSAYPNSASGSTTTNTMEDDKQDEADKELVSEPCGKDGFYLLPGGSELLPVADTPTSAASDVKVISVTSNTQSTNMSTTGRTTSKSTSTVVTVTTSTGKIGIYSIVEDRSLERSSSNRSRGKVATSEIKLALESIGQLQVGPGPVVDATLVDYELAMSWMKGASASRANTAKTQHQLCLLTLSTVALNSHKQANNSYMEHYEIQGEPQSGGMLLVSLSMLSNNSTFEILQSFLVPLPSLLSTAQPPSESRSPVTKSDLAQERSIAGRAQLVQRSASATGNSKDGQSENTSMSTYLILFVSQHETISIASLSGKEVCTAGKYTETTADTKTINTTRTNIHSVPSPNAIVPLHWVEIGVGQSISVSTSPKSAHSRYQTTSESISSNDTHTKTSTTTTTAISTEKSGEPEEPEEPEAPVLMLVSDYGYCYNSHSHNTRSSPKVCTAMSAARPTKHVLDYTVGLVEDWLQLTETNKGETIVPEENPKETVAHETPDFRTTGPIPPLKHSRSTSTVAFVTPCHGRLMHGSFDQGSRPSVALGYSSNSHIQSKSSPVNQHQQPKPKSRKKIQFVEVHEAIPSHRPSGGECGNPMHRDGLVVDSFPIHDWIDRLQHKQ
mmetsp:Transcript_31382/g.52951  ORF Transcript_31382/g.52951 Transcript_31382/m.52951 type:complete len:830 (-) Transcript_31382:850-3339(-)